VPSGASERIGCPRVVSISVAEEFRMDRDDRPQRGSRRKHAALVVAVFLRIVVISFVGYNTFYVVAYN